MQGGTLSDDYPSTPKALFVFEQLLATCAAPRAEARAVKWKRFERAMDFWMFNVLLLSYLRQFNDRFRKNFDVITWHPSGFSEVLADRLTDVGVHPQKVFTDRFDLVQFEIAMSPEYDVVYDPDPQHRFGYGYKVRTATVADFQTS